MRVGLFIGALCLAVAGAALAEPNTGDQPRPELPRGEGAYVLRSNPCGCLAGAPELDFEVKTAHGWERVAVENAEEDVEVVVPLRRRFEDTPGGVVPVRGVFTNDLRPYGDQHAGRVLRLLLLDPPAESE